MKYSTIPRVSARPRRTANPYIGIEAPKLAKAAPAAATRHYPCAYCRKAPGATRDHVVPKSYVKKGVAIPETLARTVPCCLRCNALKGARRLVPRHWRVLLPLLAETFPGTPWRVWSGGTDEAAYRETHV